MAGSGRPSGRHLPDARWLGTVARVATLLLVVTLLGLLVRAGIDIIVESERTALDLAETNLRNLVWLEAQRTLAREGPAGLPPLAGQDPRQWAEPGGSPAGPGAAPHDPEAVAAGLRERWHFDERRGELVYRSGWLPGGERRWRVELMFDGADSPTPGLPRNLRLVQRPPRGDEG
ncbi:hypothetical protein [Silanimonas sp.]|uniref:hypothetical protein n=1 Tax=Silanimonas sp. TaxID=1929290 RepID=UPI001BBCBE95|nr:hypothetical protein [Silanimonas sp.]MBS3896306.1 hypothetical protein [Silanimonas sp.]